MPSNIRDTEIHRDSMFLIVREGAVGDVVMLTPIIAVLRRRHPSVQLHMQTSDPVRPLLQYNENLDLVAGSLDRNSYSKVFDFDGSYERRDGSVHPLYAYADDIGVPPPIEQYYVPTGPDERQWAADVLSAAPHREKTVLIGLRSEHRSTSNWMAAKWLKLIQTLSDVRFVIVDRVERPLAFGNKGDGAPIYDLPNVIDLTGKTRDLLHVVAILEQVDACVTVDTSVLHLANAANCHTVALMAGKSWHSRRWLAGSAKCIPIEGKAPCYPCQILGGCPEENHCLEHVTVAMVADALGTII